MLLQQAETYSWLAPFAYGIVFTGIFFFLFHAFEVTYSSRYDRPFIRQYFAYKKLSGIQKEVLKKQFSFYNRLSRIHRRQFEHRVSFFLKQKKFIGRDGLKVTDDMKLLVASVGCMLSFGRKNYTYGLIETVLLYPKEFYSTANNAFHKGEFNPQQRIIVFSWKDFEEGYDISNDKLNLGIHEFMHAMQLEALTGKDADSSRFLKQFQNILKRLTEKEMKDKLDETRFFRDYAFTNQYEFMAVLAEYFIEAPAEFRQHFPEIYRYKKKLLNFNFPGY